MHAPNLLHQIYCTTPLSLDVLGSTRSPLASTGPAVEASQQETFHKKTNSESPGSPLIFDVGTSRLPQQSRRNPGNPGHPGGKQGVSWHGPPLYRKFALPDLVVLSIIGRAVMEVAEQRWVSRAGGRRSVRQNRHSQACGVQADAEQGLEHSGEHCNVCTTSTASSSSGGSRSLC